jgi:hypothetical protein
MEVILLKYVKLTNMSSVTNRGPVTERPKDTVRNIAYYCQIKAVSVNAMKVRKVLPHSF